jgi:hypothetical protein
LLAYRTWGRRPGGSAGRLAVGELAQYPAHVLQRLTVIEAEVARLRRLRQALTPTGTLV